MENNEEKVTYKGEEMSPQEFVERMEIDTKKKERNAESIARQKLLKKQEELERRKAFASALIPTEEDKIPDNYGPGSDQQEEPTDMSMYQVNMPFDIQQAPVQQFQSLEIPQTQEARLGGLISLMDDSKIDSFKKGGMKTSKSKDGTITNTFRNKDGNTVVQVKNKDGKYYEKVIRPEDTRKTLGALQQAVSPEFKALSYQDPTLEERVNYNLGNPQRKARNIAHYHAEDGEDDIDNIRHPFAGRYTAEALYKMRKKDTPWAPDWMNKGAAWLDANMLGVAHEAGTILRDERPWNIKLREAAEDIYNNGAGINVGLSDRTARQKTDYLLDKAYNFELPDGRGEERPFRNAWQDPYDKKRDGGLKSYLGGGKKENVDASIYNHPKREDMKYRKLNGKWQIMGEHTAYNWVDVKTKDPKNYEKRIKAIEYGKQKDTSDDPEDLVPKNILIRQAYKESRFNKNAENNKNKNKTTDYGLTQINEKGALADYNKAFPNNKIKKEDLKNPEVAKRIQKWYMNMIYDKDFINKGNIQKKEQRIAKTVASYNMGSNAIFKVLTDEKNKFKGSEKNNPIYNNYDWLKNKSITNPQYVREIMGKDKKFNLEYKDAVKDQKFYKQGGLFSRLMDDNNISTYKKSKKK